MIVKDPVCGMKVNPDESNWVVQHNDADHYFCSERCQRAFVRDLDRYTQMSRTSLGHSGHGGDTGGCCGGGTHRGWYSYVQLDRSKFVRVNNI